MNHKCRLLRYDLSILMDLARTEYRIRLNKSIDNLCPPSCGVSNDGVPMCFSHLFDYAAKLCLRLCYLDMCRYTGVTSFYAIRICGRRLRTYALYIDPSLWERMVIRPPQIDSAVLTQVVRLVDAYINLDIPRDRFCPSFYPVFSLFSILFVLTGTASSNSLYVSYLNGSLGSHLYRQVLLEVPQSITNAGWDKFVLPVTHKSYAIKCILPKLTQSGNLERVVNHFLAPRRGESYVFQRNEPDDNKLSSIPLTVYYYTFDRMLELLCKELQYLPQLIDCMIKDHSDILSSLYPMPVQENPQVVPVDNAQLLFDRAVREVFVQEALRHG